MVKNENEQYICKEIPNIKLRFKNKDKIILETILDTLTTFHSKISSGNQEIEFEVMALQLNDYYTIIENINSITEANVTANFIFTNCSNGTIEYQNITYPPFNRIVVTKNLTAEDNDSPCFEFSLYKY